jgi:hypothetical protein
VPTTDYGFDLEEIRRHRAELRESMSAVEQALAAPAPGRGAAWAERVHVALVELISDFDEHVTLTEGPDGLYEDILGAAPRLTHTVALLRREHAEIGDVLRRTASAADGPVAVAELRDGCTSLLGRLIRHRQRGADLVYEAFESDIGGQD